MGVILKESGVARMMKERFPAAFEQYSFDIKSGLSLGEVSIFQTLDRSTIFSPVTQKNYGREPNTRYVSYDAIDVSFSVIIQLCKAEGFNLHLPNLIGAGLGGGDRNIILAIIESNASKHKYPTDNIFVWKYEE